MPESYQVNWSSKKQPFEVLANTNPYPVQVLSTLESNISTIVVNLPALFLNSNRYSIDFTVCTSNNTASLTQLFIRNNTDHYERVTLNSYLTPTSPFVYNNSWTNTCYTQTLSISPNICDAETNTNCNGQTDRTIDIGATFSGNGRIFVAGVTVNNMGDS